MLKRTVLFIDDDTEVQDVVQIILEEEGISLVTATNPVHIDEIKRIKPDVILLDEWLPGRRGSVICAELKSTWQTSHIPVVLISAAIGVDLIAKQCQADAYVEKPFDIFYLKQLIQSF